MHNQHQCFRLADEMEEAGVTLGASHMHEVATTNRVALLAKADPDFTAAAIDKFLATYDIRIFAPSHTNVIRKDIPRYMAALRGDAIASNGKELRLGRRRIS